MFCQRRRAAVDPFDGMVLYRADGDELVLVSSDGGATWSPSASGITTPGISRIAASPNTAGRESRTPVFSAAYRPESGPEREVSISFHRPSSSR